MKKYKPKNKIELRSLIENNNIYLEDIDTSFITDMSMLFEKPNFACFEGSYNEYENYNIRTDFSGIEKWDTSNVKSMKSMFHNIKNFNININDWNVCNVSDMSYMFFGAESFNQPLDKWNISNVKYMICMFKNACNFNQNLNAWNINIDADIKDMFLNTSLKENPNWYYSR
ncbi:BspA family leucine-rich repeat surface protein [uncultured Brachyspira sp.]|uniref:BspA family leucine-rich repeat surface protein n=1 Tax=uncultured Brachyspira sp. TaxID=221953 RepID=UPI0026152635|nr:BspA family leucine-rich repeat surface protein [uncultured Brachyspira sp.]